MLRKSTTFVLSSLLVGLLAMVPALAGSITGVVKYEGTVPNLKPVKMDADPGCAKKHATPQQNEMLVLGDGNTMGNIMVKVISGAPQKGNAAPSKPAVINQDGCRYDPHVLGVMVGQEIVIKNSDGLLHNVHALPKVNSPFNMAMPASRTEATTKFDKAEPMFKIKCDVHPWMGAWVEVLEHPYFDVTGANGKFEIKGLPAGTYEIEAWHERLGTKTAKVTLTGDESKATSFTFSAPEKG